MAEGNGRKHDPLQEKFWRRMIRQHQRSGLTTRGFCLREGLKEGDFRRWRKALARRDREASAAPAGDRNGQITEAAPAYFAIRLMAMEEGPTPDPPSIEIVLPSGPTVRVHSGFDPCTLAQIIAVLQGRSC